MVIRCQDKRGSAVAARHYARSHLPAALLHCVAAVGSDCLPSAGQSRLPSSNPTRSANEHRGPAEIYSPSPQQKGNVNCETMAQGKNAWRPAPMIPAANMEAQRGGLGLPSAVSSTLLKGAGEQADCWWGTTGDAVEVLVGEVASNTRPAKTSASHRECSSQSQTKVCSPSTRGDPPKGSDGCEPHRVAAIHHGCRSLLRPKGTVLGNLKTSGVTALPNIDVM